jgi:hypothetical protein
LIKEMVVFLGKTITPTKTRLTSHLNLVHVSARLQKP